MDQELKQLALVALKNAFYEDFSALVNAYLEAAAGLNGEDLAEHLAEVADVYSRDASAIGDTYPNIWTQNGNNAFDTSGHESLYGALEFERATAVYLQSRKVFELRDGMWYFTGGEA